MATNAKKAAAAKRKEAFIEAYKLSREFQDKLTDLINGAFGFWDGFYTKEGLPSQSELEQIVINRLLQPLQEHLKTRTFEEVESEMYAEQKA